MECLFIFGFIVFVIIKGIIESHNAVKNENKVDFSSFESLPTAPASFLKKMMTEENSNNGLTEGAFSGGFNEESGFNDPSISFLPQPQQPQRSTRKVNLKRQAPKNMSRQQLPPAPPAPPVPTPSFNRKQQFSINQVSPNNNINMNFTQNDVLKAFIMQELLQKHDLNKIFERVPEINRDK